MAQTQNNSSQNHNDADRKTIGRAKKSAGAFRTISEVADELGVQQHVLRFWETKFSQVRPLKRGGGRRYYRPEDITVLKRIHELLYTEGYTIKGVQKLFREHGKNGVLQSDNTQAAPSIQDNKAVQGGDAATQSTSKSYNDIIDDDKTTATGKLGLGAEQRAVLREMLDELRELRQMVKGDE